MSSYTKTTNFTTKDTLPSGNPSKIIRGSEIDTEFSAIQTAVNSKADSVSPSLSGTITLSGSTVISTNGASVSDVELSYLDGITGNIQTAINLKAPIDSPTFTGVPVAPTATTGTNTTQLATTAFVGATAFSAALPSQTGNAGKFVTTNGINASWTILNVNPQWVIKTTTYPAIAGDAIQANTTSGAWTLTLPATPTANDVVRIADYAGTFSANNLTVGRNGSNIMGLAEDMTISTNNVSLTFTFIDSTQGWRIV